MANPALSVLPPSVRKERKKERERESNRKRPSVSHVTVEKRKKGIKEPLFLLVEFPLNNKETTATFIFPFSLFSVFVSFSSSFAQGREAEGRERKRLQLHEDDDKEERRRRGTKGTYGKTKEGFAGHF